MSLPLAMQGNMSCMPEQSHHVLLRMYATNISHQTLPEQSSIPIISTSYCSCYTPNPVGRVDSNCLTQAMQQLSRASDRARALFTDGWAWREQLQRAMDGCHTTDDMSGLSLAQYEEFDGPNIPLPSGYQVMRFAIMPVYTDGVYIACH